MKSRDWERLSWVGALESRKRKVREEALENIIGVNDSLTRIACWACLSDPVVGIRDRAAEQLGIMGKRSDVARLLPLLKDEDWCVRSTVVVSLSQLDAENLGERFMETFLNDEHDVVKRDCVIALMEGGNGGFADSLEATMPGNGDIVNVAIALYLYRFARSEYLGTFLEFMKSEDDDTCRNAINILSPDLTEIEPEHRPLIVGQLRQLTQSPQPGIRGDASSKLKKIVDAEVVSGE